MNSNEIIYKAFQSDNSLKEKIYSLLHEWIYRFYQDIHIQKMSNTHRAKIKGKFENRISKIYNKLCNIRNKYEK